jgi:hypothetical protein
MELSVTPGGVVGEYPDWQPGMHNIALQTRSTNPNLATQLSSWNEFSMVEPPKRSIYRSRSCRFP